MKNIDEEKLAFSGLPGKKVNTIVLRDGKEKSQLEEIFRRKVCTKLARIFSYAIIIK